MIMKRFTYYLLYGLVYALSLLPFWLLYLISDALFLLVYHVVRYRRKIVWKNLTTSFPGEESRRNKGDRATLLPLVLRLYLRDFQTAEHE